MLCALILLAVLGGMSACGAGGAVGGSGGGNGGNGGNSETTAGTYILHRNGNWSSGDDTRSDRHLHGDRKLNRIARWQQPSIQRWFEPRSQLGTGVSDTRLPALGGSFLSELPPAFCH